MTNVSLSLAKDKTFQNLVVTNSATFKSGFLDELTAGIVDAGISTIGTVTCQTLNQVNSSINPFTGITLAANQLVALDATKTLITYPYSQTDTYNTAVQRTATNGIVDDFVSAVGSSNQLVFGTGTTTTINVVQTGLLGGLGIGTTVPAAQWIVAGASNLVNQASGPFQVGIAFSGVGSNPNQTRTRVFLDVAPGSSNVNFFGTKQSGVQSWQLNGVQTSSIAQQLNFTSDGSTTMFSLALNSPPPATFTVAGNMSSLTNGFDSLGNASQRWSALYLTSSNVQQTGSINGAFAFTTPTGTGTTVAPSLGPRTSASAPLTNNQQAVNSPVLLRLGGVLNFTAGATSPIPMAQYGKTANQVTFINAQTSGAQTLVTPLAFSFVVLDSLGTNTL